MKIIYIAVILLLFSQHSKAQDTLNTAWQLVQHDNLMFNYPKDAIMVDSLRAYVVGGLVFDGAPAWISRTRDGGATWELMERRRNREYWRIAAFDEHNILVVSAEDDKPDDNERSAESWKIRRLEEGDTTGSVVLDFDQYQVLGSWNDIKLHGCFPNGSAYASLEITKSVTVTDSIHMFRTLNYGHNWEKIYTYRHSLADDGSFYALYVPAPSIAHVVHFNAEGKVSFVESTYDDGASWLKTFNQDTGVEPPVGGWGGALVYFPTPNPNLAFFEFGEFGDSSAWINLETGTAQVFKRHVRGMLKHPRWSGDEEPYLFSNSVKFFNDRQGLATMGIHAFGAMNVIFTTEDGGRTWDRYPLADTLAGGYGSSGILHMLNERVGILLGNGKGNIFMTRTGGGLVVSRSSKSDIQLYPNPTQDVFTIELELQESGLVQVELLDLAGRRGALLHRERMPAGSHVLKFNPDLPKGIYFCRITANGQSIVKKIISIK